MQVTVPVNCSGCSSLIVQTRFDLKPFAHFEREHARWFTHAVCEIMSRIRFSNYFISYLMKIYELYLTYSIIIISPAPDRDWDSALHVVPNLSQQARHQLEIVFLRSAFLETADQTPPSEYRPIMIGSRSIGAPLVVSVDNRVYTAIIWEYCIQSDQLIINWLHMTCRCVYIYIYTHTHTHIYTHMYTYLHKPIYYKHTNTYKGTYTSRARQ